MTLKEILDQVLRLSGAGTESAYAGSGDDSIERLVDIANRSATDLKKWPWQALRSRYEFTLTTATQYDLPDDFQAFIPDTMYSDNHVIPADFPTETGLWSYLQATSGGTGARYNVRWYGGNLHVYEPDSGQAVSFEYLSNNPVLDTDGTTAKTYFDADTDTFRLDDELLLRDVLWRYKKLVGIDDWQVDAADFQRYEAIKKGQDGAARTFYPSDGEVVSDPYYNLWRPVPNS